MRKNLVELPPIRKLWIRDFGFAPSKLVMSYFVKTIRSRKEGGRQGTNERNVKKVERIKREVRM